MRPAAACLTVLVQGPLSSDMKECRSGVHDLCMWEMRSVCDPLAAQESVVESVDKVEEEGGMAACMFARWPRDKRLGVGAWG